MMRHTLAAAVLLCATASVAADDPWYLTPCADGNANAVDDYLESLPGGSDVDCVVVFATAGFDSTAANALVDGALTKNPFATRTYTSPRGLVFVENLRLAESFLATESVGIILGDASVVALRPLAVYRQTARRAPAKPILKFAPRDPQPERRTRRAATLHIGSRDAPPPVQQRVVRVYFVGSGVNDSVLTTAWGFTAKTDDPMVPSAATNPTDDNVGAHDSFLASRVDSTVLAWSVLHGADASIAYADVQVTLDSLGTTTLREVVVGLDAVIEKERTVSTGRAVVLMGVDASGVIANHTIIWTPGSEDSLVAFPGQKRRILDPTPNSAGDATPTCDDLLDRFYATLDGEGIMCVTGAGNDAADSLYPGGLINVVGVSPHTIVAAALEDDGLARAAYSNWALPPGGESQNGHPDVAAFGRGTCPAYPSEEMDGTSVAASDVAAACALALAASPGASVEDVRAALAQTGAALPPAGEFYGARRLDVAAFVAHVVAHASPPVPDGVETRVRARAQISAGVGQATMYDLRGRVVGRSHDARAWSALARGVYVIAWPNGLRQRIAVLR